MDGKSKNLTQEYIEQIKALFPEVVTEVADNEGCNITHKVDMEKLAILLGEMAIPADDIDYRNKYQEKFTFEWAGKRRAIVEAQKRSSGTLRPCPEDSVDWDSTENLYIEGDNLEVLKLLQNSYLGAIKMIYIDPPYNTGKDFVYKDNYKDNLENYLEQTNTTGAVNSEASGRYHTNWLNMMYPRLKLARNLLTDDGVIFISIDDNEVDNLKKVCNEIFGEDGFIAKFIWEKRLNRENRSEVSTRHDYVLCFSKNTEKANRVNLLPMTEQALSNYSNPDNDIRGLWKSDPAHAQAGHGTKSQFYTLIAPNGKEHTLPSGRCWLYTKGVMDEAIKDNKIWFGKVGNGVPRIKTYLNAKERGLTPETILFAKDASTNEKAKNDMKTLFDEIAVFDTPKPVELITIFHKLAGESGIILDFFSGSATTAHAVMQLNAEDGGNRKYICVQLPEPTPEDSEAKKAGYDTIPEIAKERIRRAGTKISEEQKAKGNDLFSEEKPKLDIGFKVFKLDRSNVKYWDVELESADEKVAKEALTLEFNKVLEILKDNRTEADLLYEVMLKLGLKLSDPVEEVEIEGKRVFVIAYGLMVVTFAKEISYQQIGKMLDLRGNFIQPSEFKVVIADESFATNNDKTNAIQLFKQRGITNFEIV